MTESRAKHAFSNMLWGIINKIISIVGPFLIRSLMIKKMGGDYAGLSSLFTSILQVLNLAELGISSAIVFSMYEPIAYDDNDKICALYNFYKKAYWIIGTIILTIGIILIPFVPKFVTGNIPNGINLSILYLIYLVNTVISYFMFGYKESLLTAYQHSDIVSNILTVSNILLYVMQTFFILVIPDYYLYSIMLPLSTVLANILKSIVVDKLYPTIKCVGKLSKSEREELYKKIIGLMIYKISQVFRNSFDSIILSMFLGLLAVTKYQNYYYIMNALAAVLAILSNSIVAGIGNSVATETVNKNRCDFNTFYILYNWLSGWCTICLLCLYQDFIKLWLGEKYVLSNTIVYLCCIYFYSMRVGDIAAVYRQAVGLWWEDKLRPIIESVTNLLMNILVVKYFGMAGVLVSTIITVIFINIPWASYILFKVYFKTSVMEYYINIIWNTFVVLFVAIITTLICNFISYEGTLAIMLKMIICLVVPNVLFFSCYVKSPEFETGKKLIIKMLKR